MSVPLPNLSLSTGPALSEAVSGSGTTATGAFSFKQPQPKPLAEQLLPWAVGGLALWLIFRRR